MSGSFNNWEEEKKATRRALERAGYRVESVDKCNDWNKCDCIAVVDKSGVHHAISVECKWEAPARWRRWGQYGFEGGTLMPSGNWKPSKAEYSEADMWLFYTTGYDGDIQVLGLYNFIGHRDMFIRAQSSSESRVTYSYNTETGERDSWQTLVYFVDPVKIEGARII